MIIKSIYINGIRNLKPLKLGLDPKINLIYGLNGAGKTGFLESISFLTLGRSFRANNTNKLINLDRSWAGVAATCVCGAKQVAINTVKHFNKTKQNKIGGASANVSAIAVQYSPSLGPFLPQNKT